MDDGVTSASTDVGVSSGADETTDKTILLTRTDARSGVTRPLSKRDEVRGSVDYFFFLYTSGLHFFLTLTFDVNICQIFACSPIPISNVP